MRSRSLLWDGADPKHRHVPRDGQGTGKQLPHPEQSCAGQSCCPFLTPTAAPSTTHGSWHGSSHMDTAPSTSQPTHQGKFKDRKKRGQTAAFALVVPWPGQTLCLGKVKAPPPLRSRKGDDQEAPPWLSQGGWTLSACSMHSYSNHKAATPGACPRSAPTWDQHLDCKHPCRGEAGDWGQGKARARAGQGGNR